MRIPSIAGALATGAVASALFAAASATRDALFLTSLHASALPAMMIAAGLTSWALALAGSRTGRLRDLMRPPVLLGASAGLFVLEWTLRPLAPSAVAIAVYLHVSAIGPWLVLHFWSGTRGKEAGARIAGAIVGAVLAARVAVAFGAPTMLLFLAAVQVLGALPLPTAANAATAPARVSRPSTPQLNLLIVLAATSAGLLDYLFKTSAIDVFGTGDGLLRFFVLFHSVTGVVVSVVQGLWNDEALKRHGPALPTAAPSIALLAGSLGGVIAPGFGSLVVARAGEAVFRTAWLPVGQRLLSDTTMAAESGETAWGRASIAAERLGEALSGSVVRLALVFLPFSLTSTVLAASVACATCALVLTAQLSRSYQRSVDARIRRGFDEARARQRYAPTTAATTRLPYAPG